MKFTISSEKIKEVTNKLGKVLSGKSSIPILSGMLVEATENAVLFTGSDGTESVIHLISVEEEHCTVEKEGKVVLPKDCIDVLKKLKGNICFEASETTIEVTQKNTKLQFSILDADEYPKVQVSKGDYHIVMQGSEFANLVKKTVFAASNKEIRPILTGINMNFSPNGNFFVATDSHRLARVKSGAYTSELRITVPAKTLDFAVKSFDLERDVVIFPTENNISFANGKTILYTRLLEGTFPETSRLIPEDFTSTLVVNRQELIDSLDLLHQISNNSVVQLTVGEMFVELLAKGEGSAAKGKREIGFEQYTGEKGFQIAFSGKYMMDALKSMDCSSVSIKFVGVMKPFVVEPVVEEVNELQLILPVRTV